jgi:hypothetical protein
MKRKTRDAIIAADLDAVPVRIKKPDPQTLHENQLTLEEDGSIWRVIRSSISGAEVRCEFGKRKGDHYTISSSAAGHGFTAEDVLVQRIAESQVFRDTSRDENRCANCWPGESAVIEGVDRARDPGCPEHIVAERTERDARISRLVRREKITEKPEDIARVLQLRAEGKTYIQIGEEMSWADSRCYRIVKAAGLRGCDKREKKDACESEVVVQRVPADRPAPAHDSSRSGQPVLLEGAPAAPTAVDGGHRRAGAKPVHRLVHRSRRRASRTQK